MRTLWIALLLAFASAATASAQPVVWHADPAHSTVEFTARHLAFAKVRGSFQKWTAQIEADAKTAKITKLTAEADAASVDTGVDKRDDDLRSDHFFDAKKFPKLKLVLKSITWKGNAFTAVAALTIRDVTKDVTLEGELLGVQTVNFGKGPHQRAAYEANAKLNRKEFGLKWAGVVEGISIVGDEVELHLQIEMSTAATS